MGFGINMIIVQTVMDPHPIMVARYLHLRHHRRQIQNNLIQYEQVVSLVFIKYRLVHQKNRQDPLEIE